MRLEFLASATNPRESAIYYQGLAACYGRFGADEAARGRLDADRRIGLFLVLARERHQVLGGVGIHLRLGIGTLPLERALAHHPLLAAKLERRGSVAELSGLWVEERSRRTGLSERLMQAATAALPILGANTAVGFSHQHVLSLYAQVGLLPDAELAHIPYPNDRYCSTVLWADALELSSVPAKIKRRILHARRTFAAGAKIRLPSERPPPPSATA